MLLLLLQQRLFTFTIIGLKPNMEHMYLFPTPCRVVSHWLCIQEDFYLFFSNTFFFVALIKKKNRNKNTTMNTWGKYFRKTHVRVFLFFLVPCWKVTSHIQPLAHTHPLTHTHLQTSLCILNISFIENPLKQTSTRESSCTINQLPITMMMLASICMSHKSVFWCDGFLFFVTQILHYYYTKKKL